jgi:hypothetical protein
VDRHVKLFLPYDRPSQCEDQLVALLRQATGLDEVLPERPPVIGARVATLDALIGTKSTQRISLHQRDEGLALSTKPAELKPQAKALYRTDGAEQLLDLLARRPEAWRARPNAHLAFRNASPSQRLYLNCRLPVTSYVRRWMGDDFTQIRAYHREEVRESLWPWLRERQYAAAEDYGELDQFMNRLGRRDAHLRPSIEIWRIWPWAYVGEADERGTLAGEVRNAITELLTVLGEPLPPACGRGG